MRVIHSFNCADTQSLFLTGRSRRWSGIAKVAIRKLDQLDAAAQLLDLRIPPGNHLEELKADREGQHSIRINLQWRICCVWKEDGPHDVEIVDYH